MIDPQFNDWSEAVFQQECDESYNPKPSEEGNHYKYLYIKGNGTLKAEFFMTYEGGDGNKGFWCPRTAILSDDLNGNLVIAKWCKVKEIYYS